MALDRYGREVLLGMIITIVTVIIAYAWNQYIVEMIDKYLGNNTNQAVIWKTIYLLVLTTLAVLFIFWALPRFGFSLREASHSGSGNENGKESRKRQKGEVNEEDVTVMI